MGSAASINLNKFPSMFGNTISSLNRGEYIAAIINLEASIYELNSALVDHWGFLDQLNLRDIKLPVNQTNYVKTVSEMEELMVSFQMKNHAILNTITNRQVERYWAKYINNCKKYSDTIIELRKKQQDINQRLTDYMTQSRYFVKTCPEDKVEYARLVKIQKKINRDAIWLRGDKQHFYKTFKVVDIDPVKIDVRATSLFIHSNVYWGTMGVQSYDA